MQTVNPYHIGIASGYFNPLHEGHLEYLRLAHSQVDYLYVIVNSDYQRELKGSKFFQTQEQRLTIISALKYTSSAVLAIDTDRAVSKTIEKIYTDIKTKFQTPRFTFFPKITFFNGGDQTNNSIPEAVICTQLGINLKDGLGDKVQSSSWLLK